MRPRVVIIRRNPALKDAFVDKHGIIHPIASSKGYSEKVEAEREQQRRLTGIDSATQQLENRFERWGEREKERQAEEERTAPLAERLHRLQTNAAAIEEELKGEPAAKYTHLMSERGRGAESGLIPWATARRLLPRRPEYYRTAIVEHNGRKYLRSEYVLDELASNLGYADDREFRDAIDRVTRDKKKLDQLKREIAETRRELRHTRRNPSAWPQPNPVRRFLSWLWGEKK